MRHLLRAQGATEYLVLLAVVLIIALVGIALLGFFPGTASDAQIAESQIYWESASPLSISESNVRLWWMNNAFNEFQMFVTNNGNYPIRITKIIAGNQSISQVLAGSSWALRLISDVAYIAPGETYYFGDTTGTGLGSGRNSWFRIGSLSACSTSGFQLCAPEVSLCKNTSFVTGVFVLEDFGFEYVQYIEGQQITKRQMGTKPLAIKCI